VNNLPSNLQIVDPVTPKLEITVEGLRKDASTLNERNVYAGIDLSHVSPGKRTITISRDQISLPTDRVYVVNIKPAQLEFEFRKKPVQDIQQKMQ